MKHKKALFSMLLLSLLLATPLCSNAQSALDKLHLELGFGTGTPKDKTTPFGASVDLNVTFYSCSRCRLLVPRFPHKGLKQLSWLICF